MAEFADILQGARELDVDVAHLNNVGTYLTRLVEADRTKTREAVKAADDAARTGGASGGSALGSGIDDVGPLTTRMAGTFEAVDGNIAAVAECLEKTAKAMSDISTRYQTVEERNHVAFSELSRRLPH
jgi:hypothetical protein